MNIKNWQLLAMAFVALTALMGWLKYSAKIYLQMEKEGGLYWMNPKAKSPERYGNTGPAWIMVTFAWVLFAAIAFESLETYIWLCEAMGMKTVEATDGFVTILIACVIYLIVLWIIYRCAAELRQIWLSRWVKRQHKVLSSQDAQNVLDELWLREELAPLFAPKKGASRNVG